MIDLITVVFQQELYLIEIQARSIELYIDSDKIGNIFVVVNDEDCVVDQIDHNWWGINSSKVKLIARSHWGETPPIDGWSSQQLYKLLAANESNATWSMCLDAKTWFVQKLDWHKLFQDDRVCFVSHPIAPVFEPAKQFTESFLGITHLNTIGPGGVPFMFHTETVKDMIKYIETKTGNSFYDFFVEHVVLPHGVTEFILYSGFVKFKHQYAYKLYTESQHYQVTNLADWQLDRFDKLLRQMAQKNNLTASVQGKAYQLLTDDQFQQWFDFLASRQLIANTDFARNRLNILR